MVVIVPMIVTAPMIVRVIVVVRMGVPQHVLMPVIVTMMMRAVLVIVFENRLHTRSHRDLRRRLRIQLLAEQQHQGRSEEREQRNQPDLV